MTCPRRDLHAHAGRERVIAEVRAPRPARDRDVDLARQSVEAHLAVAVVDDRPDVAGAQSRRADGVFRRLHDLVDGVGDLHHHDLRRVEQAHDVLGETEDGRPAVGLVRADALEDPSAVVQRVGQYVRRRVTPWHQLAVVPDPSIPVGHRHRFLLDRGRDSSRGTRRSAGESAQRS